MIKMVVNGIPKNQSRLLLDTKIFKQINENNLKAYITERKNKTMSNVETKQKACENIIEIVKLIDRITDISNMAYKPEQKEQILNKLYDLLDFQISLMEDNEDE